MSRIIVLIPHYNNFNELVASILSIKEDLRVDVLIVDDGSDQKPDAAELKRLYKYGQIFVEFLEANLGIEFALNHGLNIIEKKGYDFIGRLDCGDLNKENRFTKQIQYLKENPDVYLLGTWVDYVDEQGNFIFTLKHPVTYSEIKKKMYLNSMFVHPSVIFKSEVIERVGKYPIAYKAAEDYAFFFKIIKKFKAENYPERLVLYKVDSKSISSKKRSKQVRSRLQVIKDNFYFGFYPAYGLLRNLLLLCFPRRVTTTLKQILKR